jgi:ABC-type uncharacterized transport system fused permease/ATPase subunit
VLSLGERQLISFARLFLAQPRFAFLDVATSALTDYWARTLYGELARTSITYVSIGENKTLFDYHDVVLELCGDGQWNLSEIPREGRPQFPPQCEVR